MTDKTSIPQLKNDASFLARSIVLVQIAIVINVASPLVYLFFNNRVYILFESHLFLSALIAICDAAKFIASCFVLVGIVRIVRLLKNHIHIFYFVSAITVFIFFCVLRGLDLWHYILLINGRGYTLSELRPIMLLIFPPLGIISCCAIALRINQLFQLNPDKSKQIYILSTVIGLIWLLGIILASIQWWQNRQTIEFDLRYLVIRNHRWQLKSIYCYFYCVIDSILPLLWQIWLCISLHSARRQLHGFNESFGLPREKKGLR